MSKCLIRSNVSRSEMWPWNQYLKVFTSSGQPSLVKEKGNYRSETFGNGKVTSSSSISHPLQISKTTNTSFFKRVTPKSYTYQATNNVNLKSQTYCRNI